MKSKKKDQLKRYPAHTNLQKDTLRRSNTTLKESKVEFTVSQDRLRALVEMTSDWIWEIDSRGAYTYVSPKVTEFLGYRVEEVLGKTPFDLMPTDEASRLKQLLQPIFTNALPISNLENINLHKDGHFVVLETSGVPILDTSGNLVGYRGIDRDIGDRKQMEDALRESEEKYHSLLEHAYDAILIADFEGNLLEVNKKAEELLSYTKEELLGTNFSKLHPEEDFGRVLPAFREMVEGKIHSLPDTKLLRKDGKTIPVDITGGAIGYGGRQVAQAIFRDITEQKLMEEALKQSEHRFRNLSEASLEAIVFIEDGIIIDANEALNRLFGYEGEDLRGKLATDFIVPERRPFTDERMRTRTIGAYETLGLRKDGSTFPIEVNPREFEQDGKKLRISAVRDLTERYKIEKQLKDYQQHLEMLVEERTNELKESEKKYRDIFEDAIEGIYQSTPGGRFLRVNPALASMFGFKNPDEFVQSITDIKKQLYVDPTRRLDLLRILDKEGIARNFEFHILRRDGTIRYASVNARAVKDKNGKTLYIEGMFQDVTEKKLATDQMMMQRDLALKLAQIDKLEEGLAVILQTAINNSGMECGGVSLKNPETSSFRPRFLHRLVR